MIDPGTSRFLDTARWLSALAVVLSHTSALILSDARHGDPYTWTLAYLQNTGHLAVVVFFVLSGYLVGGQELLRVIDGRPFDPRRYAIQRFSRIYTVFLPALLATVLLDTAGRHLTNGSQLYTNPALAHVPSLLYPIAARDDAMTFLGNTLMLQTIAVEPYGGNGPLWSLANEWWYYVVFGLVLAALSAARARFRRLPIVAASALLLGVLPASITLWFAVWLLGVGAALLARRTKGLPFPTALTLMTAGFVIALLGMHWTPLVAGAPRPLQLAVRLAVDTLAGLSFATALLSAHRARPTGSDKVHRTLAGFSFTLYAVHFPALVFLGTLAHDQLGMPFSQPLSLPGLAWVSAIAATIIAYAWCFAILTEHRTQSVRAALTRLFG